MFIVNSTIKHVTYSYILNSYVKTNPLLSRVRPRFMTFLPENDLQHNTLRYDFQVRHSRVVK